MSGHADGHEVTDEAKGWLDWFEKSGAFPHLVQAHREYQTSAGLGRQGASAPEAGTGGSPPSVAGSDRERERTQDGSATADGHGASPDTAAKSVEGVPDVEPQAPLGQPPGDASDPLYGQMAALPTSRSGAHAKASKTDVTEVRKLLQDALSPARLYVRTIVDEHFGDYRAAAQKVLDEYNKKAAEERERQAAVAQVLLTLPFFVGSSFIAQAAGMALKSIAPMLAKAAQPALVTKYLGETFREEVGKKVLEAGLDKIKEAIGKSVPVTGSIPQTMVNYVGGYIDGLPDARDALNGYVEQVSELEGLAAVLGAMRAKSRQVFAQEFKEHTEKFEKQVAPIYAHSTQISPMREGSISKQVVLARLYEGKHAFNVQVKDVVESGEFDAKGHYEFVQWVDSEFAASLPGASNPIRLKRDQIRELPSGPPPTSASAPP